MKTGKFWARFFLISIVLFFITLLLGNVALYFFSVETYPIINGIVETLFIIFGLAALISIIMAIVTKGVKELLFSFLFILCGAAGITIIFFIGKFIIENILVAVVCIIVVIICALIIYNKKNSSTSDKEIKPLSIEYLKSTEAYEVAKDIANLIFKNIKY